MVCLSARIPAGTGGNVADGNCDLTQGSKVVPCACQNKSICSFLFNQSAGRQAESIHSNKS